MKASGDVKPSRLSRLKRSYTSTDGVTFEGAEAGPHDDVQQLKRRKVFENQTLEHEAELAELEAKNTELTVSLLAALRSLNGCLSSSLAQRSAQLALFGDLQTPPPAVPRVVLTGTSATPAEVSVFSAALKAGDSKMVSFLQAEGMSEEVVAAFLAEVWL